MEAIRASIESLSVNESEWVVLYRKLNDQDVQEVLGNTSMDILSHTIQQLHPSQHSLGMLYLLYSQIKSIPGATEQQLSELDSIELFPEPMNAFFQQTALLLMDYQLNQVKLAYCTFAMVIQAFVNVAIATKRTKAAIWPLQQALRKFQGASQKFTPIHTSFVLACLHAKCYFAAKDLLKIPIFEIDTRKDFVKPEAVIKYFYYGGMVFLGLKQFEDAKEFFQMAVSLPAKQLSAVAIEAYKKYVLTCLILYAKPPTMPKLVPSNLTRQLKTQCKVYNEFAGTFKDSDGQAATDALAAFESTNNYGLAKQCLESLSRQKIKRLTDTFLTLSLSDIAKSAELSDPVAAERHVLTMIESGDVHAIIDKDKEMVTFIDDEEAYDTTTMLDCLHDSIDRIVSFSEHLRQMDITVTTNPQYLLKTRQHERRQSHRAGLNFGEGTNASA